MPGVVVRYVSLGIDVVAAIAGEFPWSHAEIMALPAGAAFHYAMRAAQVRWQRIEDARLAGVFAHLDEKSQRRIVGKINLMLSGPGWVPTWEETLTPSERQAARQCQEETDRLFEQLKADGLLLSADGKRSVASMLAK